MSSTCELLRLDAGERWTSITTDPWTNALAEGTLSRDSIVKYLIQDHRFLNPFSVLLSSMLAHTNTLEDRIFGAQFLGLILGKENTYFERSFEALQVTEEERGVASAPATLAFDELMRETAKSTKLHCMLAVLLVCEWSYQTWGERALKIKKSDLPFYFDEWISLHSGEYFDQVVTYLQNLLNALTLSPVQLQETKDAFNAAVQCELDFWKMANENIAL